MVKNIVICLSYNIEGLCYPKIQRASTNLFAITIILHVLRKRYTAARRFMRGERPKINNFFLRHLL